MEKKVVAVAQRIQHMERIHRPTDQGLIIVKRSSDGIQLAGLSGDKGERFYISLSRSHLIDKSPKILLNRYFEKLLNVIPEKAHAQQKLRVIAGIGTAAAYACMLAGGMLFTIGTPMSLLFTGGAMVWAYRKTTKPLRELRKELIGSAENFDRITLEKLASLTEEKLAEATQLEKDIARKVWWNASDVSSELQKLHKAIVQLMRHAEKH